MDYFREAGLPRLRPDVDGISQRYGFGKGVVRKVYMDTWRVAVEPEEGGYLDQVLVVGDIMPEVHEDTTRPSHVIFTQLRGHVNDVVCWPLNFRRMFGPETTDDKKERHFYQKNQKIHRVQDITIRITPDNKIYLFEAESEDYVMYDMDKRTLHAIVPHIFLGTDEKDRLELHTETNSDQLRVVIPKALLGKTAVQDADGISYTADQLVHVHSTNEVRLTGDALVHLIAPAIKLTASGSITLDPPHIYLGGDTATERLIYGDSFLAFLNAFLTLFNAHVHTGVQTGGGTSGTPTTPATAMTSALLATNSKVL